MNLPTIQELEALLIQRYMRRIKSIDRSPRIIYGKPIKIPALKPVRVNPYTHYNSHPTIEHKRFNHVWHMILQRCYNIQDANWPRYGGRGITVSPEWCDYNQFFMDMWPRPSARHSIDRIDNDGPYSKANCRWATYKEQSESNKRKQA